MEVKETKEISEIDEEDRLRVRGSFSLWKKPSGNSAQIQAEMTASNYGERRDQAKATHTNEDKPAKMETRIICLENEERSDSSISAGGSHTMQMRVEISREAAESHAVAEILLEADKHDQLDGEICYQLYQRMKEVLEDIGFEEAVWPHKIPADWELIGQITREHNEIRWVKAGK